MTPLHIATAAEQVADYLREQLMHKAWVGTIPGGQVLARQLGVGRMTIDTALSILEEEGLLVPQGPRRRRRIEIPEELVKPSALRVAVLFYERGDETQDLFLRFQNKLKAAGCSVIQAPENLTDMGGRKGRLTRMIKEIEADAWVVIGGLKEVLQCFVQRQIPVFGLYGGYSQLRMAAVGPDQVPAMVAITHRLIGLGHRRIVLLESSLTLPDPAPIASAFRDELAAHGITVSNYNMPGWEGGFEGFYRSLDSLFAHTPPTAIIIYSATQYFATTQFLINRGLRVPQDVSLVCIDKDPFFDRFQPSISHVSWNSNLMVNRIVRWANNISQGKEDIRQTKIKAEFIEGGTVGVAPKSVVGSR
jgi:DNA-binding LacI/PurR family transcriptional regulator